MPDAPIHGFAGPYSASRAVDALAKALGEIKAQDRLTYADLGAVLGKSEDQAAKYCAGEADMGLVSYARGKREWNGRFTGSLDRLCVDSRPGKIGDQSVLSALCDISARVAKALEDGSVDPGEVRDNRAALEHARDAIDELLGRLRPAA